MSQSYNKLLFLLLLVAAIVLAAGLGLRDPWPADEPRFALIAKDMVEGGTWLIPRVGGVLYPDKPPLFFWLVAALLSITDSLRVAFLLPAFFAGLGVLWLVTDLARRLWNPQVAIWTGATLLATTDRRSIVFLDNTCSLWFVSTSVTGPGLALVHNRRFFRGSGGHHKGRRVFAFFDIHPVHLCTKA